MKYFTLDYNANAPTPKCIKVPVNSEYGVAVKVYKDGQLVSADLSVDGTVCTEGPDGWQLAELSSGNAETMKTVDVEIGVVKKEHVEIDETQEIKNQLPFPANIVMTVPLSSTVEDTVTLAATDVEVFQGYVDGVSVDDIKVLYSSRIYYILHDGKWFGPSGTFDSIELTPEWLLHLRVNVPASSTVEGRILFKANIANGTSTYTFPLYVQERDLDYFEK